MDVGRGRRARSARGRRRSCPSTSTAIRSTWIPLLELARRPRPRDRRGRRRGPRRRVPDGRRRRAGWRRCGSFGTLSTFSFYANKLITTGEGGMVLTDDDGPRRAPPLVPQPLLRTDATLSPRGARPQLPPDEPPGRARRGAARADRRGRGAQALDGRAYDERLADLAALQLPVERAVGEERLLDVRRRPRRGDAGIDARGARRSSSRARRRDAAVLPRHARAAGPAPARPLRRASRTPSPSGSPARGSTCRRGSRSPTAQIDRVAAHVEEVLR